MQSRECVADQSTQVVPDDMHAIDVELLDKFFEILAQRSNVISCLRWRPRGYLICIPGSLSS